MLNRIKIWGICRQSKHIDLLFVMFLKPFLNISGSVAGSIILLEKPPPLGNTVVMKGCTCFTTMFRLVVDVKVTLILMLGPLGAHDLVTRSLVVFGHLW